MTTEAEFYRTLFKGVTTGLVSVLIKGDTGQRLTFANVSSLADDLDAIVRANPDKNVFYGMGVLAEQPTGGRGRNEDVVSTGGFYIDLDMPRSDDSRYAERAEVSVSLAEILQAFEEIGLPPTAVTNTGNGSHAYILLDKPFVIANAADRGRVLGLFKRLSQHVRSLFAKRGWSTDVTSDLARLDRAIGSNNVKSATDPKRVTVDYLSADRTYNFVDLEAIAPAPAEPAASDQLTLDAEFTRPEALANFDAIYAADPWVRHCVIDAATLREPEWFAFLLVLAHCQNGEALAHKFSSPYPGYSEGETAEKFRQARQSKPPTYSFIRTIIENEPDQSFGLYGTVKSPISLGYMDPELARLIAKYAFVVGEDRFVRLDTFEERSKKAFDAENLHLLKAPTGAYLSSKIAIKVARRDYLPGAPRLVPQGDGSVSLNVYRPPAVVPSNVPWPTIAAHFETVFPDQSDRDAILDRFAMAVQKPGQKIKSAVLMFGPEGGGKGTLIDILTQVVGRSNVVTLPSSAIDDAFQDDRVNKQVVVFNEVSGIARAAVNGLKELVTEPTIMVQGKGVPRFSGRTPSQVWLTTNDDAALQLNAGDRRYLVFRTPDIPPDTAYFDQLYRALPLELPGFAYAMMVRDISGFNPHARPQVTSAKIEMITNAASPLEFAIREAMAAEVGIFESDFGTAQEVIRAVILNGWSGRSLHSKSVGAVLASMGTAKMERVTLPDGSKPYFHAWRNKDTWLKADRATILAHRVSGQSGGIVVPTHPDLSALVLEAERASASG